MVLSTVVLSEGTLAPAVSWIEITKPFDEADTVAALLYGASC